MDMNNNDNNKNYISNPWEDEGFIELLEKLNKSMFDDEDNLIKSEYEDSKACAD